MTSFDALPVSVLDSFPAPDGARIRALFEEEAKRFTKKLLVLDDDPTGIQTVHDVPVYTDWEEDTIRAALAEEGRMAFLLTNSRSFTAEETAREHRLIARRAVAASKAAGRDFLILSRGDSTLRGHYPLELDVLRETLEEETGEAVHGQILCPFFREGGRFTIGSVHYVREGDALVPAGETEFARDKTFGYRASHLGEYVEEKSGGRYRKEDCLAVTLSLLRAGKFDEITDLLCAVDSFRPILVDAVCDEDVLAFCLCLLRAMRRGKRFLLRTAAAVPKALGCVTDRPLLTREELLAGGDLSRGGIVIVGSHVKKTTEQLERLRQSELPLAFLEFRVAECRTPEGAKAETARLIREAEAVMDTGRSAVVYTTRTLLAPESMTPEEKLQLSVRISAALTDVAGGLTRRPRFIVAKGGITSSDVGTRALRVKKAIAAGQAQPGVPVWTLGEESLFPGLSYVIFPGNVGTADTLLAVVRELA